MNTVFRMAIFVFVFLAGSAVVGGWFASGYVMTSAAMDPAVQEGETCLVNRMSTATPRRGEIILLRVPKEEGQILRRVVAFGGETVQVQAGEVLVNGEKLAEPWLQPPEVTDEFAEAGRGGNFGPEMVPAGYVFVLGDNRPGSRDSRQFGPVSGDRIMGKVWTVFGPLTF